MAKKRETCLHCNGAGLKPDWTAQAADAKKMRRELGMSLREVAAVAGCSAMFVSDLERGRRGWDGDTAKRVWSTLVIKHAVRVPELQPRRKGAR